MMAMLRRFIALLLARTMLERDLAGKPGPTFPDHAQKPGVREGARRPKRKPGQRTGHTLLVAAQYSQKSPENNALFAIWLAAFRAKRGWDRNWERLWNGLGSAAVLAFGGINAAQHFLEVIFDRFVAE